MSYSKPAYDSWYKTAQWQKLRKAFLAANPCCVMCLPRYVEAKVCDHIEPHKGDEARFWGGPFQALCKQHHDITKQSEEKSGRPKQQCDESGWPV